MGEGMAGGKKGGIVHVPFHQGMMAKQILDEGEQEAIGSSEMIEMIER
jgi:hypothetical protein